MKKNLLALFLLFTSAFQSATLAQTATKANSPARKVAENITAEQLKDYLYYVASDEMEGRDTPSRGLDLTAKFIALNLKQWGFKPAGDNGTFFQKFALNIRNTDAVKTQLEIGGRKLRYGKNFFTNPVAATITNSPLVFAGNGWRLKSKNLDALKDTDVKGKTVVIYSKDFYPDGVTQADLFSGKLGKAFVDWIEPLSYAREKGAAGLIIIATPADEENWQNQRRQRERGGASVEKFTQISISKNRNIPTIVISSDAAENLFQGESITFSEINRLSEANSLLPTVALTKTASYTVQSKIDKASTQNVVAVWEGSDPNLKNEMVAIGAHYDHVGVNPNAKGEDKIWNGADDDGSGTVAVLSIAEALAKSPKRPKRSVLFVWHAGEEKGLWGSEYFNKFPTVDIKSVIAQLNIDMIGRSRKADDTNPKNANLSNETEVYVIGSEMMSSELGEVTKSVNNSFLNLTYNYKYDDPKDPNRFFFRSDHFNYAVNGIPIVFWFDGVHEDYHQPGDEPEKIDYAKMERVTRTIFLTLWQIADLKERPKVDKQLPPELTVR
ncbi:MAG: M20/M25/M40 family metallo-hydrolase [Acidobacteriota bacterium]|nr:M20/M25/M40 family metallo-hydrolase [Acidobacteriota bacterium]